MPTSKQLAIGALMPLVIGFSGLAHLMSQPRFASIRTVDVVQLTGSGACFGAALVLLIFAIKSSKRP